MQYSYKYYFSIIAITMLSIIVFKSLFFSLSPTIFGMEEGRAVENLELSNNRLEYHK